MDEWCVDDIEAYVARAVAAVSDPEALAATRAALRGRMARSELCDGAGLARALEDAYASMRESVSAGSSSGSV
jgi:predicted O-linked N-acetylglucosamine transferase (SPINDLY family)